MAIFMSKHRAVKPLEKIDRFLKTNLLFKILPPDGARSKSIWLHCASSIKELTLKSNGRRWLSRVSVSSSSGPSGLSKELEHKTEEEKENCQANEKPNNGGYGRLSKGTRRICNQIK